MRKIIAAVLVASLAAGCTLVAPALTYGAHSTPAPGDVAAEQRRTRDTEIALAVGIVIDVALIAAASHYDAFGAAGGD